jgi:hypothetical protein
MSYDQSYGYNRYRRGAELGSAKDTVFALLIHRIYGTETSSDIVINELSQV